jgi:hypothetical protein
LQVELELGDISMSVLIGMVVLVPTVAATIFGVLLWSAAAIDYEHEKHYGQLEIESASSDTARQMVTTVISQPELQAKAQATPI